MAHPQRENKHVSGPAQTDSDEEWLVLEGDWGGQVYLTIPKRLVGPGADVKTLLCELDAFAWKCNEGDGQSVSVYRPHTPGRQVGGGMGDGELQEGLWLHREFRANPHWMQRVRKLLNLT